MPGAIFIFMTWSVWIVSTFLLSKENRARLPVAVLSLMTLISAPLSFSMAFLSISGPAIILLAGSCTWAARWSFGKKLYFVFAAVTILSGYAGLSLLELYDPVWFLMDRTVLFSTGMYMAGWILYPASLYHRLMAIAVGSLFGELFLGIYLSRLGMPYLIGSMEYLDIFSLTCTFVSVSYLFAVLKDLMKQHAAQKMTQ